MTRANTLFCTRGLPCYFLWPTYGSANYIRFRFRSKPAGNPSLTWYEERSESLAPQRKYEQVRPVKRKFGAMSFFSGPCLMKSSSPSLSWWQLGDLGQSFHRVRLTEVSDWLRPWLAQQSVSLTEVRVNLTQSRVSHTHGLSTHSLSVWVSVSLDHSLTDWVSLSQYSVSFIATMSVTWELSTTKTQESSQDKNHLPLGAASRDPPVSVTFKFNYVRNWLVTECKLL